MPVKSERQKNFFDVCGQCENHCCRDAKPPITLRRRKIIEAYLKEQKIPVENPFVQTLYTYPREDKEGCCIFYNKNTAKCMVHPVKPETCVAGPITFGIDIKTKKIEWYLKMEKICSLAGVIYKNKKSLHEHFEIAKKEILKLVSELDPEALKAILKIEETETLKIGEEKIGKDVLNKL
jgi:Fe-S-cluster containining protein